MQASSIAWRSCISSSISLYKRIRVSFLDLLGWALSNSSLVDRGPLTSPSETSWSLSAIFFKISSLVALFMSSATTLWAAVTYRDWWLTSDLLFSFMKCSSNNFFRFLCRISSKFFNSESKLGPSKDLRTLEPSGFRYLKLKKQTQSLSGCQVKPYSMGGSILGTSPIFY